MVGHHQRWGQLDVTGGERDLQKLRRAGRDPGHDHFAMVLGEVVGNIVGMVERHELEGDVEVDCQLVSHLDVEPDHFIVGVYVRKGEVFGEVADANGATFANPIEAGLAVPQRYRIWDRPFQGNRGRWIGNLLHAFDYIDLIGRSREEPAEVGAGRHRAEDNKDAGGCNSGGGSPRVNPSPPGDDGRSNGGEGEEMHGANHR